MTNLNNPTAGELMQLDGIVEHLGIGKRWLGPNMISEVIKACMNRASNIIDRITISRGKLVAERLANHYHVRFEEVNTAADIDALENKYLRRMKEIGFAQLRDELSNPKLDALLFQRIHAHEDAPDRWVAVLNLLFTHDRAYWDRFHELSHRIAEPQQQLLPFRREHAEKRGAVEALIDTIAGELAFHRRLFRPMVQSRAGNLLTIDLIRALRARFAPTASLLAVMNATVKLWPEPAMAFTGTVTADEIRITLIGHFVSVRNPRTRLLVKWAFTL